VELILNPKLHVHKRFIFNVICLVKSGDFVMLQHRMILSKDTLYLFLSFLLSISDIDYEQLLVAIAIKDRYTVTYPATRQQLIFLKTPLKGLCVE
jgi:hypothetical protein